MDKAHSRLGGKDLSLTRGDVSVAGRKDVGGLRKTMTECVKGIAKVFLA